MSETSISLTFIMVWDVYQYSTFNGVVVAPSKAYFCEDPVLECTFKFYMFDSTFYLNSKKPINLVRYLAFYFM